MRFKANLLTACLLASFFLASTATFSADLQQIGQTQFENGKFSDAAETFTGLLTKLEGEGTQDPRLATCEAWLAECYNKLNRKDDAIAAYQRLCSC